MTAADPLSTWPRLLVSVRSAAEAAAALEGGAGLLDVKEPGRGPLGRPDDAVLREVLAQTAGRLPVSLAFGELSAGVPLPAGMAGLSYVKCGLAGWQGNPTWREVFLEWARKVGRVFETHPTSQAVVVAYADWRLAEAPSVEEVRAFACRRPGSVLLVDTWEKAAPGRGRPRTLLDWMSFEELTGLRRQCSQVGVRLALAGSLGPEEIRNLLEVRPDWFAVRGAACEGGRGGRVSAGRVRELAGLLATAARSGS